MTCQDCGDSYADCLTADRVRVCVSCLYERAAKERDDARARVVDLTNEMRDLREECLALMRAEDSSRAELLRLRRLLEDHVKDGNQLATERNEARSEATRLRAALTSIATNYHWKDSPAGVTAREALEKK